MWEIDDTGIFDEDELHEPRAATRQYAKEKVVPLYDLNYNEFPSLFDKDYEIPASRPGLLDKAWVHLSETEQVSLSLLSHMLQVPTTHVFVQVVWGVWGVWCTRGGFV